MQGIKAMEKNAPSDNDGTGPGADGGDGMKSILAAAMGLAGLGSTASAEDEPDGESRKTKTGDVAEDEGKVEAIAKSKVHADAKSGLEERPHPPKEPPKKRHRKTVIDNKARQSPGRSPGKKKKHKKPARSSAMSQGEQPPVASFGTSSGPNHGPFPFALKSEAGGPWRGPLSMGPMNQGGGGGGASWQQKNYSPADPCPQGVVSVASLPSGSLPPGPPLFCASGAKAPDSHSSKISPNQPSRSKLSVGSSRRPAGVTLDPPLPGTAAAATLNFPEILHEVVSNPDNALIIAWLPHGKGFHIRDKGRFAEETLPRHFDGAKFTSFTRRLKRWNFKRVPRGPEMGAYYHR